MTRLHKVGLPGMDLDHLSQYKVTPTAIHYRTFREMNADARRLSRSPPARKPKTSSVRGVFRRNHTMGRLPRLTEIAEMKHPKKECADNTLICSTTKGDPSRSKSEINCWLPGGPIEGLGIGATAPTSLRRAQGVLDGSASLIFISATTGNYLRIWRDCAIARGRS